MLGGSSTGTLLAAALKYCREQTVPKRAGVRLRHRQQVPVKMYNNDYWMLDNGTTGAGRSTATCAT